MPKLILDVTLQQAIEALRAKDYETAHAAFLMLAQSTDPKMQAIAWNNAGILYEERGLGHEAHAAYRLAGCFDPTNPDVLNNLGAAASNTRHDLEAAQLFAEASRLNPKHANALNGLASVACHRGMWREARHFAERAIEADPNCVPAHWNLSLSSGALGDWVTCWNEHAWRKQLPGVGRALPTSDAPWLERTDQLLPGLKLLVYSEQGFGDTIQWGRLLRDLAEKNGIEVILETYSPLQPLFKAQPWIAQVVDRGGPWPAHDLQTYLLDLPRLLCYIPAEAEAYLRPSKPLKVLGKKPLVGLAWKGRQEHGNNAARSASTEFAQQIVDAFPQYHWVSLQFGEGLKGVPAPQFEDFDGAANLTYNCEAVVTIDSAPAHVAGAVGVPTLVLHSVVPEWRWQACGWYRSMTHAAQPIPGSWESLLPSIETFLERVCVQAV